MSDLKIGGQNVGKIYLGDKQVFGGMNFEFDSNFITAAAGSFAIFNLSNETKSIKFKNDGGEKITSVPANTAKIASFNIANESSVEIVAVNAMTLSFYHVMYEPEYYGEFNNAFETFFDPNETISWGSYINCGIFYITA